MSKVVTEMAAPLAARPAAPTPMRMRDAAMDGLPDAMLVIDTQTHVLEYNQSAEQLFDFATMVARGRTRLPDLFSAQAQTSLLAWLKPAALFGAQAPRGHLRMVGREGQEFDVELTLGRPDAAGRRALGVRLRHPAPSSAAAMSAAMPLTGPLAPDTALAATFDQAALGLVELDGGLRLKRVNQAFCHLLGRDVGTLLGTYLPALMVEMEHSKWLADVASLRQRPGCAVARELQLVPSSGLPQWVRLTISLARNAAGQSLHFIGVVEDISARIAAEQALASARELEIQIGARIQQSLLVAHADQRLPSTWLSTYAESSQGIDGDFVEVLTIGQHCVDIIAGDVMGKGVGAALIGAATKMQIGHCLAELLTRSTEGWHPPTPAQVVSKLNKAIASSLQALDAFVTLSYVRIDTQRNTVTWVGCGHEEPLLLQREGAFRSLPNQHPPLGVLDRLQFEQSELPMAVGDGLFICSDGVHDAMKADGARVGRDAILDTVRSLMRLHQTPAAILHALRRDLLGGTVRATDDMTMVMAIRTASTETASRRELQPELKCLLHVHELVSARALGAGMEEVAAGLFAVACVEAYTNIVRHAKGLLPGAPIELVVELRGDELRVSMVYLGDPYLPESVTLPAALETYPEGGFGTTIMRSSCDEVDHSHIAGVNTVCLRRLIHG